jgi:predicted ATPase
MQILAFQVKNFRSIVDSGWIKLSPDGITVFVGQNESGKSSLLAALGCALSFNDPSSDDFRANSDVPSVDLSVSLTYSEIEADMQNYSPFERDAVSKYLKEEDGLIKISVYWHRNEGEHDLFSRSVKIDAPALYAHMINLNSIAKAGKMLVEALKPNVYEQLETINQPFNNEEKYTKLTPISFGHIVWQALPLGVLFNESDGLLPDTIDINEEGEPYGAGALAAENYLRIADINLAELMKKERRSREYLLNKANEKVTKEFNLFWNQTIGKTGRLSLKCEIDHYDITDEEKAGKPHLTFWILNGHTQLYPRQRSQGVRWFISFYLQLKASESDGLDRVFLLDEPGSNLHIRAQDDVLDLINKIRKNNSTVIYTTHSPHLLEYSKLYRVHAIQRNSELDDSPSVIIGAHKLGTASSDTLSPILSAMGANLSSQQVIQRKNNVLLEEMSGYYYLSAFWKLAKMAKPAYFIAATGVNKIEPLANMFRGWGLEFIVAVDDDTQGREAYKSMKKNLFGDDENLSRKALLKLPDCPGIEDAFSQADFCRFILNDSSLIFSGPNSTYLKTKPISKPVIAFAFSLEVEKGNISIEDFDELTRSRILKITEEISSRL